jgi:hypothetical protein
MNYAEVVTALLVLVSIWLVLTKLSMSTAVRLYTEAKRDYEQLQVSIKEHAAYRDNIAHVEQVARTFGPRPFCLDVSLLGGSTCIDRFGTGTNASSRWCSGCKNHYTQAVSVPALPDCDGCCGCTCD